MGSAVKGLSQPLKSIVQWMDNHHQAELIRKRGMDKDNTWDFPVSFALVCLSPILLFWVGWSPVAIAVAAGLYWLRMFGITAVYHRYFSHRTYKTGRVFQFILAFIGNMAGQRGPLWWAAHHRHHHKFSDQEEDAHSPLRSGFWNSHVLWWARRKNVATKLSDIKDFAKYPELVFLDRFDSIAPLSVGVFCYALGAFLQAYFPALGTTPWQMTVWGFGVSTVVLFHGVAVINSLAHVMGRKRFPSGDGSRNSFILAFITMGEGWHNNHHFYANSTRQGFYWWQWDPSYYLLWALSKAGLVWDLKPVPQRVMNIGRGRLESVIRPKEPGLTRTPANPETLPESADLIASGNSPSLPDFGAIAKGS